MNSEEISKLSDFELNKAISKYQTDYAFYFNDDSISRVGYKGNICINKIINYCVDWSDLMPLVVEHGISHIYLPISKTWTACTADYDVRTQPPIEITNKNPQRALAECLLLVLQDKENKE